MKKTILPLLLMTQSALAGQNTAVPKTVHQSSLSQVSLSQEQVRQVAIQVAASEGSGATGGGDIISCNGGPFLLFLFEDRQVTDVGIEPANMIPRDIFSFADADTLEASIEDALSVLDPKNAAAIREALSRLQFVELSGIKKLDTGVKIPLWNRIFGGCSRIQVAIQDTNAGVVALQQKVFDSLDSLTKALVKVHEAYISLAAQNTNDLKQMETIARGNVARVFSHPDFNALVMSHALSRMNRPQSDATRLLLPWFRTILLRMAPDSFYDLYQQYFSPPIRAGFSPGGKTYCQLPVIDWFISRVVTVEQTDEKVGGYSYPVFTTTNAIDVLIDQGADVNAPDISGAKPIFWAMKFGYPTNYRHSYYEVAKDLIVHGANINETWCRPGSKAGDRALTPLEYVEVTSDRYYLREKLGAKTGDEMGVICPDTPALDPAELQKQGCDQMEVDELPYFLAPRD